MPAFKSRSHRRARSTDCSASAILTFIATTEVPTPGLAGRKQNSEPSCTFRARCFCRICARFASALVRKDICFSYLSKCFEQRVRCRELQNCVFPSTVHKKKNGCCILILRSAAARLESSNHALEF